jgi:hypothetical protein
VWAEYYRLWKEEGWTQQQIADAKDVKQQTASLRLRLHEVLPNAAKKAVTDELFDEGHCEAIISVLQDIGKLSDWITTTQAQTELTKQILNKHRGSSKGIKPTVANVRDAAKEWKEFIGKAESLLNDLPDEWQALFVQNLSSFVPNSSLMIPFLFGTNDWTTACKKHLRFEIGTSAFVTVAF